MQPKISHVEDHLGRGIMSLTQPLQAQSIKGPLLESKEKIIRGQQKASVRGKKAKGGEKEGKGSDAQKK